MAKSELKRLPEKGQFCDEIVDHLFPHLNDANKRAVVNLFDHAFDHPWADDELKANIVENICREHGIKIPKEFDLEAEYDDDEEEEDDDDES